MMMMMIIINIIMIMIMITNQTPNKANWCRKHKSKLTKKVFRHNDQMCFYLNSPQEVFCFWSRVQFSLHLLTTSYLSFFHASPGKFAFDVWQIWANNGFKWQPNMLLVGNLIATWIVLDAPRPTGSGSTVLSSRWYTSSVIWWWQYVDYNHFRYWFESNFISMVCNLINSTSSWHLPCH